MMERLLRANEEQARASGQTVELQRQLVQAAEHSREGLDACARVMEKIAETLGRIETDQREGREVAIAAVIKRVDERTTSGGWQAIAAWVFAGGAVIIAAALTMLAVRHG